MAASIHQTLPLGIARDCFVARQMIGRIAMHRARVRCGAGGFASGLCAGWLASVLLAGCRAAKEVLASVTPTIASAMPANWWPFSLSPATTESARVSTGYAEQTGETTERTPISRAR